MKRFKCCCLIISMLSYKMNKWLKSSCVKMYKCRSIFKGWFKYWNFKSAELRSSHHRRFLRCVRAGIRRWCCSRHFKRLYEKERRTRNMQMQRGWLAQHFVRRRPMRMQKERRGFRMQSVPPVDIWITCREHWWMHRVLLQRGNWSMSRKHIVRTADTDVGVRLTPRFHPHGLVSARHRLFNALPLYHNCSFVFLKPSL